jgi:2-haloacid dehalogenase
VHPLRTTTVAATPWAEGELVPKRPDVVVFDVNETLSDLSPMRDRLQSVGAPPSLLDAWFAATLRDGFALTAADAYAEFADVARAALRIALTKVPDLGRPVDEAVDEVLAGFTALEVHPDVPAGMRRLREAGVRLVTLTNGSAEMSRGTFERAGVLNLLEPYRWAAQVCGVPVDRMALVAVHPWDTDGAKRAGLMSAWVDREGVPYPDVFEAPDITGPDLPSVAEALLALDPG